MCCICSYNRLFHSCFIFTSCTLPKCFCCSFSPTRLYLLFLSSQVRRLSTCFSACTQTWPVTTPARRPLRRSSSSMGTTTTEASTGKKSHSACPEHSLLVVSPHPTNSLQHDSMMAPSLGLSQKNFDFFFNCLLLYAWGLFCKNHQNVVHNKT